MSKKILSLLCYVLIVFVCYEGVCRFVFFKTPFFNNVIDCDSWYRIELTKKFQDPKKSIHLLTGYYLHQRYDPRRGWSIIPKIHEPQIPGQFTVITNSKGIRSDVEYSYGKNNSKTRILILGDSFTFGDEVDNKETYPYFLQQLIPNSEVINLGVNGYGHDQMLLYLKDEGIKYQPDIVILGFVDKDMYRNSLSIRHSPKPLFKIINHHLTLTNVPVPTAWSLYKNEIFRLKLLDLFNMLYLEFLYEYKIIPDYHEITTAILDDMQTTSRNIGARFMLVNIPSPTEVQESLKHKSGFSEGFFSDYCRSRHIPCVSTLENFKNRDKKGIYLKQIGHWNAYGNKIIAQTIQDYLLRQSIIKDTPHPKLP